MTTRKITALVIMGALIAALSATTAFADYKTTLTLTLKSGSAVSNPTYDETYTLSVPESLRIANTGWNSMGSMTVKYSGSNAGFNTAKKLVVTATSTNSFKLVADGVSSTISYFLTTGENDTETTSFTFTAAQITAGASQTLGVNVEDFSTKSNGTYTDEITYTVAIEDAGTTTTTTVTWNGNDITSQGNDESFSRDGVIITAYEIDFTDKNFLNSGKFTTTLGNFTKIEVTASSINAPGTGWSVDDNNAVATWTGEASNSVSFSGSMMGISTIVFTIAQ